MSIEEKFGEVKKIILKETAEGRFGHFPRQIIKYAAFEIATDDTLPRERYYKLMHEVVRDKARSLDGLYTEKEGETFEAVFDYMVEARGHVYSSEREKLRDLLSEFEDVEFSEFYSKTKEFLGTWEREGIRPLFEQEIKEAYAERSLGLCPMPEEHDQYQLTLERALDFVPRDYGGITQLWIEYSQLKGLDQIEQQKLGFWEHPTWGKFLRK